MVFLWTCFVLKSQCLSHLIKLMVLWISYSSQFKCDWKTIEILTFSISISQPVHQYVVRPESKLHWKWSKLGSGAPGPESAPRGTKSTTFALEIFQPSNFRNSFLIQYGILRFYTSNVRHTFKTKLKLEQHSELEVGTIWAASGDTSRNWESKHRGMQLRVQNCM